MVTKDLNKDFLVKFIHGDEKSFEQIYKLYAKPIFNRLLYVLKDADVAEEVLQNVFVKLWNHRENIDPEKNLYAFLLQMANNMSIDHLRRGIKTQFIIDDLIQHLDLEEASVEENYLNKEKWSIVQRGIELLPPQRKLVFILCKLEGKSYAEVSSQLAISTATISNHLVLAMKSIREFARTYQKEINVLFLFLFHFSIFF